MNKLSNTICVTQQPRECTCIPVIGFQFNGCPCQVEKKFGLQPSHAPVVKKITFPFHSSYHRHDTKVVTLDLPPGLEPEPYLRWFILTSWRRKNFIQPQMDLINVCLVATYYSLCHLPTHNIFTPLVRSDDDIQGTAQCLHLYPQNFQTAFTGSGTQVTNNTTC